MNEAAFPAEALAPVVVDDKFLTLWGQRNPENYGYPTDAVWEEDWDQTMNLAHKLYYKNGLRVLRNQVENQPALSFDEREFYTMRWRMHRPESGLPDHTARMPFGRSAWRARFSPQMS